MTTVNVAGTAIELYNGIVTNGGATVDAVHPGKATPSTGYAVSLRDHESQITLSDPNVLMAIEDYVRSKRAWIAYSGHYVGAWKESDDIVTLDVTTIVPDLETARQLGAIWKQRAIYDIANDQVITLEDE